MKTTILIIFLSVVFLNLFAQTDNNSPFWLEMQNNGANFYEIQDVFKNKKSEMSFRLYKQYNRWEWYWQKRVNDDGTFPTENNFAKEYINYFSKTSSEMGNWESMGPNDLPISNNSGLGRINCITFFSKYFWDYICWNSFRGNVENRSMGNFR